MQFDLTVKYEINDNHIKSRRINLGNRPEFYYWGNPNQLPYDIYGNPSIGFNYKL